MRMIMKAVPLIMLALWVLSSPLGAAYVNPSYVKAKIKEVRVSPNTDGSNAVVVFKNENAVYQDMMTNPVLGAGIVPDGTYKTMMIRMSDNIKFSPATSEGSACVAGTEYTQDVAYGVAGSPYNPTLYDPTGAAIGTGDNTEQEVWIFIRTEAIANGNTFDPREGLKMTAPLVVNGDTAVSIVINFDGAVTSMDRDGTVGPMPTECLCEAPVFQVR